MAQDESAELPPPPEDLTTSVPDVCRIWIGNLDTRINEFTLLKLLKKYGSLKHYDFLYHKSGPEKGKPRGYCFATYTTPEEAEDARVKLNGKLALSRKLVVKQAHAPPQEEVKVKPGSSQPPAKESQPVSASDKIAAIEAKLRDIDQGKETSHIIASEYIEQANKLPERKTYKERPQRPYRRHRPQPRPPRRGR